MVRQLIWFGSGYRLADGMVWQMAWFGSWYGLAVGMVYGNGHGLW